MNVRQGMFRLWVVVSSIWMLGIGIVWYQHFTIERTQIAALDECGKIYPPDVITYGPPPAAAPALKPYTGDVIPFAAPAPSPAGPWTQYAPPAPAAAPEPQAGGLPPGFVLDKAATAPPAGWTFTPPPPEAQQLAE